MKNTVKNVLLVLMASLFITCLVAVFVSIAALMVGNGALMVIAVITAMVSAPVLVVLAPLFDALDGDK